MLSVEFNATNKIHAMNTELRLKRKIKLYTYRKRKRSIVKRGAKTEETEPKQNQQNMIISHLVMFLWLFELSPSRIHTHTRTVTRSTRSYSLYLFLSLHLYELMVAVSAKYIKREHLCACCTFYSIQSLQCGAW